MACKRRLLKNEPFGSALGLELLDAGDASRLLGNAMLAAAASAKRSANERERSRAEHVNHAFLRLRSLIPTTPADRKLSKVETLKLARSYIEHLTEHVLGCSTQCDSPRPSCTFCAHQRKSLLSSEFV